MAWQDYAAESEAATRGARQFLGVLRDRAGERGRMISQLAAMQIRDYLVPPKRLSFRANAEHKLEMGFFTGPDTIVTVGVHRHALSQMQEKVKLGAKTVSMLLAAELPEEAWKMQLLAYNLNELFSQLRFTRNDDKFMLRTVQGEVRGFVSKKFKRSRSSSTLFHTFVDEMESQGALSYYAHVHPIHLSFQMFKSDIFEPVVDDPIAIGLEWSNSDFGVGRHTVRFILYRLKSKEIVPCRDVLSQIHIGSVLQTDDVELSPETELKDAEAQASALRDVIRAHLSDESLTKLFNAIKEAQEKKVDWTSLKQRLSDILRKGEVDKLDDKVAAWAQELPPVTWGPSSKPESTAWFAAAFVSRLAANEDDDERRDRINKLSESYVSF